MACIIKIAFTGNTEEIINKAKLLMEKEGGTFNGDSFQGNFSVPLALGKIVANYSISGQELEITVLKTPFIVSCRKIESFLKEQIG